MADAGAEELGLALRVLLVGRDRKRDDAGEQRRANGMRIISVLL